ncbi:MAG: rhomboid family intramembrane serine protease [Hyphomicrobiaceae bacterium]
MVFPLYDDNPFKRATPPLMTWGLIALNVIVFMVELGSNEVGQAMLNSFGATPAVILREVRLPNSSLPPEITLVTSLFLHGGWEHILGNMVYLWVFGDDIEDALGPIRFLIFYLLSGIAATAAFIALDPHSTIPLVGASGAISGILAAYLMLRPCAKVSVFILRVVVRIRALWVIGAWILLQIISILNQPNDGVAYTAHGGGLIAGAVLFLLMRPAGVHLFTCVEQPGESEGTV